MKKTKAKKITTGKKKSKKWIGIVVALFVVFGLFGGGDDAATEYTTTKDAIVEEVADVEIIKDEIVEETVEEVEEEDEVISNLMEEPVEEVVEVDKSTPAPVAEPEPQPTPEPAPQPEPEPQPAPAPAPEPEPQPAPQQQSSGSGYAVNGKNGKIHIVGACPATGSGDSAMEQPVYFNSYEEAEAYSIQNHASQKKRQCGNCW